VLVPHYRLAPDHPFLAAVEDAGAAFHWLLDLRIDPKRIVMSGDSSAGGLTMATLLSQRDKKTALPAGEIPISAWVGLTCSGESLYSNAKADLTVTKASLQRMAGQYLHGADPHNPLASPNYADLSGLPPLFIVVGGAEGLLDDAVRLARNAGMAGTNVTLNIVGGMQHIFPIYVGVIPKADAMVRRFGSWIN
jgi:monoterpene epsilon-lactone hydrolase